MTIDTENLVVSIWEVVREHIPEKKREDVATHLLEVLMKYDVVEDVKDLGDATGVDDYLDAAITILVEEHDEQEYNEDEELEF